MASKTDIANGALGRLNITQRISDIATDTSTEANAARAAYDKSLESILKDYPWPFAQKWEQLTLIETDPNPEWTFAYRLPVDCLDARELVVAGYNRTYQPTDEDMIHYDTGEDNSGAGGMVVYCDTEDPWLHYTKRNVSEGLFRPDFVSALEWRMAMEMGPGLTGDPAVGPKMEGEYNLEADRAKRTAANQLKPKPNPPPGSVRARS